MSDTVHDWLRLVERCYPERDAEAWDAPGLHVGDLDDPVADVLVSLDVTVAVLDEARERGCDLVLAHHPLLLRGLERLTTASAPGRIALHAARHGIAVAAAHTNLDIAVDGTSDPVVDVLGLVDVRPLQSTPAGSNAKLVTFVPDEAVTGVLDALADVGAGRIGEYAACSFRTAGTGTFRPSQRANPAVGVRGRLNEVLEQRLEVVVPRHLVAAAVGALRRAHPYEEVAYDLVPLLDEPAPGKGLGRVGRLPKPATLLALARCIARDLPSPHLRLGGDPARVVEHVAVCGGSGQSLIGAARTAGADVYVTGDLSHHVASDAQALGLALIDAGHHATEIAAMPAFRRRLEEAAADGGLEARLLASETSTDPWTHWSADG